MKKILIIWCFLLCSVVFAASAPQWNEFCPTGYENPVIMSNEEMEREAQILADNKTKIFYCKSDSITAKILRGVTILPALDCYCGNKLAKSSYLGNLYLKNEENKYWFNRKMQFENELKTCESLTNENKAMCYLKVREIEITKNNQLEQNNILKMQNRSIQSIQNQLWLNNLNN